MQLHMKSILQEMESKYKSVAVMGEPFTLCKMDSNQMAEPPCVYGLMLDYIIVITC